MARRVEDRGGSGIGKSTFGRGAAELGGES